MCDVISNNFAWNHFRRRIEADLAFWKADLAPLESGEMRVGERIAEGGVWIDITDTMITSHKRNLATYEALLHAMQGKTI